MRSAIGSTKAQYPPSVSPAAASAARAAAGAATSRSAGAARAAPAARRAPPARRSRRVIVGSCPDGRARGGPNTHQRVPTAAKAGRIPRATLAAATSGSRFVAGSTRAIRTRGSAIGIYNFRRRWPTTREMRPLIGITTSELRPGTLATLGRAGPAAAPRAHARHHLPEGDRRRRRDPGRAGAGRLRGRPALVARLDGICLAGGPDLDPIVYGATSAIPSSARPSRAPTPSSSPSRAPPTRAGLPLLGICRGAQTLNVARGGTLHQHVEGHRQTEVATSPTQRVAVAPDSLLAAIARSGEALEVNSFHHQAVDAPGSGLRVVAHAADGTVEAIEDPARALPARRPVARRDAHRSAPSTARSSPRSSRPPARARGAWPPPLRPPRARPARPARAAARPSSSGSAGRWEGSTSSSSGASCSRSTGASAPTAASRAPAAGAGRASAGRCPARRCRAGARRGCRGRGRARRRARPPRRRAPDRCARRRR